MITRFAPSPTGPLHLGHAFSALTAAQLAMAAGGQFILRIEDIDTQRSKPVYEQQIYEDLRWLGLSWPRPVLRQSDRLDAYDAALVQLDAMGVTYRCACTRADIRAALSAPQEGANTGPDGPVYPGTCRHRALGPEGGTIRLNMAKAIGRVFGSRQRQRPVLSSGTQGRASMSFVETGPISPGEHTIDPETLLHEIGDIVLARRDIGIAYHLAVVIDDAAQGVTLVTRGADLFSATPLHRLLQALLSLPAPLYHHHRLIRDDTGKRLAKRDDARAIATYRAEGLTPAQVRALIGF